MDKPAVPHQIRKVFEGRVFSVAVESITTRKGGKMDVEVVRHPGSVVLIPITDAGEVILVRQYRHAIGRSAWELPAGTLKPNEEPGKAATRECHEEIGLVPGRMTRMGAMYPTPGFCDEEMVFYLAEDLREPSHAAAQDEDEQLEPRAFALSELEAMAGRGELSDMKTLAGLALLKRLRP